MSVLWIDGDPSIEIDGNGAKIKFRSGNQTINYRMSRHHLRMLVEYGRRDLDRAEAEDTLRVIAFDHQPATGKRRKRGNDKKPGSAA